MGSSSFGGFKYLNCTYANGVTIEYISPSTPSGWSSLTSMLKKATSTTKSISGLGSGAFSGTGTNTVVSTTPGSSKTKQTTVTTQNLWVYVSGKAIFEISINNGNLPREEALAKKMVPLV